MPSARLIPISHERVHERAIEHEVCGYCGARPGEPCRRRKRNWHPQNDTHHYGRTYVHAPRWWAAREYLEAAILRGDEPSEERNPYFAYFDGPRVVK